MIVLILYLHFSFYDINFYAKYNVLIFKTNTIPAKGLIHCFVPFVCFNHHVNVYFFSIGRLAFLHSMKSPSANKRTKSKRAAALSHCSAKIILHSPFNEANAANTTK